VTHVQLCVVYSRIAVASLVIMTVPVCNVQLALASGVRQPAIPATNNIFLFAHERGNRSRAAVICRQNELKSLIKFKKIPVVIPCAPLNPLGSTTNRREGRDVASMRQAEVITFSSCSCVLVSSVKYSLNTAPKAPL